MRTREKKRIFKRFMEGESVERIAIDVYDPFKEAGFRKTVSNVEKAIRDCVNEIKKGEI